MQTLPEATVAQTGYRPGEAGYRRLSVALFAAGLATFAMLYSTQPLLPELARVFQVSPSQSAFSVSLATLGLGLALLVAGPASEILGRTKLMRWSVAAAAAIAVLCTLAPNWTTLLALRGIQGSRTGRTAGCGHGLPPGRRSTTQSRPSEWPLHRRHRSRRHDRSPGGRRPC